MNSISSSLSVVAVSCMLCACALSQAADGVQPLQPNSNTPQSVEQRIVPIDWERADADANKSVANDKTIQLKSGMSSTLAVPLLLPPDAIALSDTSPSVQSLSSLKMLSDERGYTAVIDAQSFTILIDASNQTFVTEQQDNVTSQLNFDGAYQIIDNGGQISIARYGALYAIQLLCSQPEKTGCITERMVREVIESLSVKRITP